MCEKIIPKNTGMLQFIPNCYKSLKMYEKAHNYYPHALEYVPDYFMTQEMCE